MTMQQFGQQFGQQHVFIFGIGYSAQVLAERLTSRDWTCAGTVRNAEKAERLSQKNITAHVFTGAEPISVPPGSHWLISVPPDQDGCPVFRSFAPQAEYAASITYLSTTGVYGDLQGDWAFEWTRLNPQSSRARARARAEQAWQSTGRPFRAVRLPGIYGPGRSPFARLRAGKAQAIIKPGQVFSRVHVDDIASGLEAMMERPHVTGIFHLCDDAPVSPQTVTNHAANLLGLPAPKQVDFETAELSPMARSFYSECKRVSNARAKSALGWFPKYRDYKAGLKSVLAIEQSPDFKATAPKANP